MLQSHSIAEKTQDPQDVREWRNPLPVDPVPCQHCWVRNCGARAGAGETTTSAAPLTYLKLFSKYKAKNKAIWMILPVHPWYQIKCPGALWFEGSSRRDQTVFTRFLSGHLMSLTFVDGIKNFEICTKCSAQASPGHILFCLELTRQDLVQDPLLVLDFFRVNGLMDLI
ncbi:RNase H domain-containing protein [Trichonephila clavipes]|nr:RNase H domain-containing protein [Trichonephila clavipes]